MKKRYTKYPKSDPAPLPCRRAAKSSFWMAKALYRVASIVIVAYLVLCIVSLNQLHIESLAFYGVALVLIMVACLFVGVLLWLSGYVLFFGTYVAYKHDVKRYRKQQHVRV